MMVRKKTEEKNKRGHIHTTYYGVSWFQSVFIDDYLKPQTILEKDLKWTLEQMEEKNLSVDFCADTDMHELKKIYLLDDMAMKYILHQQLPEKDYSETLVLSKEEVEKLENAYAVLKLRHCSYVLAPVTSIPEPEKKLEEETVHNPRRKYLDVRDLDPTKNYQGKILHRSNVKIDKLNQVPIRTVPIQLDDGRKVRLRIPEWILEGHHQRFFLEKYAPIRFGLEKTKEGNVRVSWFTTYETIFLKLDWSTSLLDYVKIPKMGKANAKEHEKKKRDSKINYYCRLSIEDEELIHEYQERNKCGNMYSVYCSLMERYHFEKEKIRNLKLLHEEIKACEDDLHFFQQFKERLPEKVFSKLDRQYRARNEMINRYAQGYEKLFCRKSNILTCPVEPLNKDVKIKKKSCRMYPEQKEFINQIITEYGYRNFREWLLANLTDSPQQRIDAWKEILDDKRNEVYWLDMMLIFNDHQFHERDYRELKKRFNRMINVFNRVQTRLYEITTKVI